MVRGQYFIALKNGKVAYDGPSSALTPAFLNRIYGAESEELFLPSFAGCDDRDEELPALPPRKTAFEIERMSA